MPTDVGGYEILKQKAGNLRGVGYSSAHDESALGDNRDGEYRAASRQLLIGGEGQPGGIGGGVGRGSGQA